MVNQTRRIFTRASKVFVCYFASVRLVPILGVPSAVAAPG